MRYFLIFGAVLALFVLFLVLRTPEWKRAGNRGERYARRVIKGVLRPGDRAFHNVKISFDGKRTELDNVIVNKNGVFVIEVKSYKGRLVGGEDDFEWRKLKTTGAGNTYEKEVRNPIRQVRRQVYILSHFLRESGAGAWVAGYVMLVGGRSPVKSGYILGSARDVDRAIHRRSDTPLSREQIEKIAGFLG
ncbi:MAG: NERD domain-containing protein [Oscillospiraceae bacterium]|nr:NERD domain-containing protein [Oscillospiraceae bacterium]